MSATTGGLLFQNSIYVGITLENILYGVELVLYFKTMYYLLNHPGERTKSDIFYAVFSSAMLLNTTIWISVQSIFCEKMWVLDTGFPGGPDAFWAANISVWYIDMATISLITLQLMTDALMIYRCWMVWGCYHAIIFPSIVWVITLVLGGLVSWITSASAGGIYFHNIGTQLGLAYFGVSVFLTAMLTCLICYRVLSYGKQVRERLACEYASPYFAIAALIIESVFPYTVAGIAFVVSLGAGSQMMGAFGYVHALLMCVSPQMLILRVAMRRAWKRNARADQPFSTVEFTPQATSSGSVELRSLGTNKGVDLEKQ